MPPTGPERPERPGPPTPAETVPVLRPLLPPADRLLPYLRRIDAARTYTNWGPLVCELERRLSEHFALPEQSVVSASSGTAALVGAILATAGRARPERPVALVPAFTFVATAIAVEACGYRPHLVDVDADSWLLEADRLSDHPSLRDVGLVVPVAAFGRPVPQDTWLAFRRRTGIAVVIDGAASFEALSAEPGRFVGDIPVSLSFHATKSFATGEGGCVTTTDAQLPMLVTEALNFGFHASRNSRSASTNGKMSEYHAAVGLAELDGWPTKCLAFRAVADRYRLRLDSAGLGDGCVVAPTVAGCYVLYQCADSRAAADVQRSLLSHDVECRLWYGHGLHTQSQFRGLSRDQLQVTERIAPLIIGLPVATDLSEPAMDRVVAAVVNGAGTDRLSR
jgi:dTDP-4-amino-4,6-dideoxygalactose transaminase